MIDIIHNKEDVMWCASIHFSPYIPHGSSLILRPFNTHFHFCLLVAWQIRSRKSYFHMKNQSHAQHFWYYYYYLLITQKYLVEENGRFDLRLFANFAKCSCRTWIQEGVQIIIIDWRKVTWRLSEQNDLKSISELKATRGMRNHDLSIERVVNLWLFMRNSRKYSYTRVMLKLPLIYLRTTKTFPNLVHRAIFMVNLNYFEQISFSWSARNFQITGQYIIA